MLKKEAVFTMKLEPELRAEFIAEAEATHRPASQVLRELMREFIQQQREVREYEEFLRHKVEVGRASMHANLGEPNDKVEARFAARRAYELGITPTQAITMLYKKIAREHEWFIELKIPNAETRKVLEETDKGIELIKSKNIDDLFNELGI